MKNRVMAAATFVIVMFVTWPIVAQELYVFLGKGQSQEQTEKDKYECYAWAKGETGFESKSLYTPVWVTGVMRIEGRDFNLDYVDGVEEVTVDYSMSGDQIEPITHQNLEKLR